MSIERTNATKFERSRMALTPTKQVLSARARVILPVRLVFIQALTDLLAISSALGVGK
jgi:hypothetical protein